MIGKESCGKESTIKGSIREDISIEKNLTKGCGKYPTTP